MYTWVVSTSIAFWSELVAAAMSALCVISSCEVSLENAEKYRDEKVV